MKLQWTKGLLVCLTIANATAETQSFPLTIDVHGAEPSQGQLIVSVFSSTEEFLKNPSINQIIPVNNSGSAFYTVDALEVGEYAVSVVYDKDNNGQLTTGLFGIPKEKIGFSNNVKGFMGPPSFSKAAFDHDNKTVLTIYLTNAKD